MAGEANRQTHLLCFYRFPHSVEDPTLQPRPQGLMHWLGLGRERGRELVEQLLLHRHATERQRPPQIDDLHVHEQHLQSHNTTLALFIMASLKLKCDWIVMRFCCYENESQCLPYAHRTSPNCYSSFSPVSLTGGKTLLPALSFQRLRRELR